LVIPQAFEDSPMLPRVSNENVLVEAAPYAAS